MYFMAIWWCCGNVVYFPSFWYFVSRQIWQPWIGTQLVRDPQLDLEGDRPVDGAPDSALTAIIWIVFFWVICLYIFTYLGSFFKCTCTRWNGLPWKEKKIRLSNHVFTYIQPHIDSFKLFEICEPRNQGDQMRLRKHRPDCSRSQFLSKLLRNFCRGKKWP
jgi:hypothetical protein